MGSELSIDSCVSATDIGKCAGIGESGAPSDRGGNVRNLNNVLVVQLSQPFGMTLCSEKYEESVVKMVAECDADGNAAAAGVVCGMILLQINGVDMQPIDLDTLSRFISSLPPNKVITLTFLTRGQQDISKIHVKNNTSAELKKSAPIVKSADEKEKSKDIHSTENPSKEKLIVKQLEQDAVPVKVAHTRSVNETTQTPVAETEQTDSKASPTTDQIKSERKLNVNILDGKHEIVRKPVSPQTSSPVDQEKDVVAAALKMLDLKNEIRAVKAARLTSESDSLHEKYTENQLKKEEEIGKELLQTELDSGCSAKRELRMQEEWAFAVMKSAEQEREIAKLKAEQKEVLQLKAQLQLQAEQLHIKETKLQTHLDEHRQEHDQEEQQRGTSTRSTLGVHATQTQQYNSTESSEVQHPRQDKKEITRTRMQNLSLSNAISHSCVDIFSTEEKHAVGQCVRLLHAGIQVKKHNRLVAPSAKWLHMDSECEKLYWRNEMDTDNVLKKCKSQKKLFGKSDSEREVFLSDVIEVSEALYAYNIYKHYSINSSLQD